MESGLGSVYRSLIVMVQDFRVTYSSHVLGWVARTRLAMTIRGRAMTIYTSGKDL
jgi:hypothetical protein